MALLTFSWVGFSTCWTDISFIIFQMTHWPLARISKHTQWKRVCLPACRCLPAFLPACLSVCLYMYITCTWTCLDTYMDLPFIIFIVSWTQCLLPRGVGALPIWGRSIGPPKVLILNSILLKNRGLFSIFCSETFKKKGLFSIFCMGTLKIGGYFRFVLV